MGKGLASQGSMFRITFYCLLFAVSYVLSGCVMATEYETLRSDVNHLRRDTFELKKDSSEIRSALDDLRGKTATTIKEDAFHAFRESQAEMHSRVLEISRDLQTLAGRFDENKYFVEKALEDSTAEMEILKAQITDMESRIKEIRDKLSALEDWIGQRPSTKPTEPKDKTARYEAAHDAFEERKYKEAREKFEGFMKEFPQDELTDNAQFWIAETYYGEKDFESAILAYEAVLKKYPNSEKVPGALLKQGFAFIEIGDRQTGITLLEKLTERYPDSREAEIAKKKIEEIEKEMRKKR